MAGGRPTHYDGDLRKRLLEGAESAIGEHGLAALSLRAVAKQSGVSHAAPAHHFRDKRALITALATHGTDELNRALRATLRDAQAPAAQLAGLGRAYVAFARSRPALFAVMLQRGSADPGDVQLEQAEAAAFETLRSVVLEAVAGGWGNGADADLTALLLWSTVHGLATLVLDEEVGDESAGEVIDTLIQLGSAGRDREIG